MDNRNLRCENYTDMGGLPIGGYCRATGIIIEWQNGPLGRGPDRQPPNGASVEDVIRCAKQRLEYYQQSQFACGENNAAINHLAAALDVLRERTARREAAGVEGTHQVG